MTQDGAGSSQVNKRLRRAGPEPPAARGLLGAAAAAARREDGVGVPRAGPGGRACLAAWGEVGAASSTEGSPGPGGLVNGCSGPPLSAQAGLGGGGPFLTLGEMACGQEVGQPLSQPVKERSPEPQSLNHVAKARLPSPGINTPGCHILAHLWEHVGNMSASTSPVSLTHG